MLQLLPLAGLMVALSYGVPMQPIMQPIMQPFLQCCETKDVGGVSYTLVGRMDTKSYQCINDCIYVKDDEPRVKFCFASGDLKVECTEDEFQGSEMPLMEGSEKPPMEGSEKPPMEGSEKPPMGGSEKPPMEGTEAPAGSDDEVVTRVKSYIDANTCDAITFSDYSDTVCGDSAVSYYKEFIYNNKRVIVSNNIPDHPAESDQLTTNPNVRCPGWQFIQLPIDPAKGSSATSTGLGTIGLAITGGAFFNDLSNPDGSLALPNEGPSLDSCLGHSAPAGGAGGPPGGGPRPPPPGRRYKRQGTPTAGRYHYHANLNCSDAGAATGANDPDQCLLIGYYQDGVPVYGFCKDSSGMMMTSCYKTSATLTTVVTVSGTYQSASTNSDYTYTPDAGCNLDEASGAVNPTTGKYSYFMTSGYPWTPIKFFGDQGSGASFCSAD